MGIPEGGGGEHLVKTHTFGKRVVRILLECILVQFVIRIYRAVSWVQRKMFQGMVTLMVATKI